MTIKWRIEGPFDSTYSLALLNRELARAMKARGIDVALFSTEGPGDFEPSSAFLAANPDLKVLHDRATQVTPEAASVTSRNLFPPRVEDMCSQARMMHLYAWEETAFPSQWVRNFNTHLTAMTCLSTHVTKMMIDNGVRIPMITAGCGVDHWERVPASENPPFGKFTEKGFVFLHVSSFFPRKGPDVLLDAYGRFFSASDDVCLVIKTFPNPHNEIHSKLAQVRIKYPDYPEVVVIEDDLSDADLKALYSKCDVLVSPSCAEGFGLPLAEAMLTGLPVITTAWSGQLDFCSSENSWLVDYVYQQADTHFRLLPSAWAVADVGALGHAMKEAAASDKAKRSSMAMKGRERLLRDFTWDKVAGRVIDFYSSMQLPQPSVKPKIGWVSTWNVKCGIATYSAHLTEDITNMSLVLAARNELVLQPDSDKCVRCWNADGQDDLLELASVIDSHDLNSIVIQFNFGFFGHDSLYSFVKTQKDAGRIVVIDMHATTDPPHAQDKKLSKYAPALRLADRVLAHTVADLNRLKLAGVSLNLALFPHGVVGGHTMPMKVAEVPTIATYGFCLPHKGLEQVVEAVALLRDQGMPVKLQMVNAEYPIDFSTKLAEYLREKIRDYNLEDIANLESRFLSDEESLELLGTADLLLFVYFPTSESASGAARYGLASGKPTLVTNLSIFSEFGDAVWRVEDNEPHNLAIAIRECLASIRSNSVESQSRQQRAADWREQHRYSWLSERLEGMIEGLLRAQERSDLVWTGQ